MGKHPHISIKLFIIIIIRIFEVFSRQWHPTPVLLPGKSHGRRSLVGSSPQGCQESDTTEQLHSLIHIAEKFEVLLGRNKEKWILVWHQQISWMKTKLPSLNEEIKSKTDSESTRVT